MKVLKFNKILLYKLYYNRMERGLISTINLTETLYYIDLKKYVLLIIMTGV